MAISAYSPTPASNASISGINVAEGCNASNINDAIRQLMADLAVPQFAGPVGVGMVATNILDITQTQNTTSQVSLLNASTGVAASSAYFARNSGNYATMVMYSTGYTTTGANRADGMLLATSGSGGMAFSVPSDAFRWYLGAVNIATLNSSSMSLPGISLNADIGGGASLSFTGFGVTFSAGIGGVSNTNSGGFDVTCVSNVARLLPTGSAWTFPSDERLKTDLVPIEGALEKVGRLRAYVGRFKKDAEYERQPFLIAQDVQAVLPEAVHVSEDGYLRMGYDSVVPLLVAAIKELKAEVAALKARA